MSEVAVETNAEAATDPASIIIFGATGLVGQNVLQQAIRRKTIRLLAISRREVPLPLGARMEVLLAPAERWASAIVSLAPQTVICAIGTTIAQQDGDKQAFTAIDRDLILEIGGAVHQGGAGRMIVISSVGADRYSGNFYLRTKGEMEAELGKIGLIRLDILRPGLLLGRRAERGRLLESVGQIIAPVFNLLLHGKYRKYRAIPARNLAAAALQFASEKAAGRFVHEYDGIMRAARRWAAAGDQRENG